MLYNERSNVHRSSFVTIDSITIAPFIIPISYLHSIIAYSFHHSTIPALSFNPSSRTHRIASQLAKSNTSTLTHSTSPQSHHIPGIASHRYHPSPFIKLQLVPKSVDIHRIIRHTVHSSMEQDNRTRTYTTLYSGPRHTYPCGNRSAPGTNYRVAVT